ncbi:hypothetical protein HNP65_000115 [Thermosipho japonicus]|uniref:Uncharacterized protein n=1 Tax=Thermosipho japonicus TaxID=90323 RepID=A0A841GPM5_9BACT|nr:hypothetical protein [Thermosipho japonicus]MBB6061693.1 hypothetical protein [Thermosipho japonicus]
MRKSFVVFLMVLSLFVFSMRTVKSPVVLLEGQSGVGVKFGVMFLDNWLTNFELDYFDQENSLNGLLYLRTENSENESINSIGYVIKGVSKNFQWGTNFVFNSLTTESTVSRSLSVGIGFEAALSNYFNIGAFIDDLPLYAQKPFTFFKPNVGIDFSFGTSNFNLYGALKYVKQEYIQFNLGPVISFTNLYFDVFWVPEYIVKDNVMLNKISGDFKIKLEDFSISIFGFYAFDRNFLVDIPMHYEEAPYGYEVNIEVKF